jgi:hypothetical protein
LAFYAELKRVFVKVKVLPPGASRKGFANGRNLRQAAKQTSEISSRLTVIDEA